MTENLRGDELLGRQGASRAGPRILNRLRRAPISPGKFKLCVRMLAAIVLCHAVIILIVGLRNPLLDLHSFRQTQTALTTYWLLKGGPWLSYETPVLGAPWSIPFEFPTFQYMTALASDAGIALDAAGRSVSFAFFIGTLWPLRMLARQLELSRTTFFISAVLLLSCPLYAYWSRTFMIESCAVFFCALWLALLARSLSTPQWPTALLAIGAGCLGALTKATTYPAFAFLGECLVIAQIARIWSAKEFRNRSVRIVITGWTFTAVPLFVEAGWVVFSDSVKQNNPLGQFLTTGALASWNFGDLAQRYGAKLWLEKLPERILPDILGHGVLLGLVTLVICITSRRHAVMTGALLIAFILPLLLFTNLHIVHGYYQYANGLFLLLAIALSLSCLAELGWRRLSLCAMILIVLGQTIYFYERFFSYVVGPSTDRLFEVARLAEQHTAPADSLIIIGDDWSSVVAYYSRRKSIAIPEWAPAKYLEDLFLDPSKSLGGAALGAIVFCPDKLPDYAERAPLIEAFVAGRDVIGEAGGCTLLKSMRSHP